MFAVFHYYFQVREVALTVFGHTDIRWQSLAIAAIQEVLDSLSVDYRSCGSLLRLEKDNVVVAYLFFKTYEN